MNGFVDGSPGCGALFGSYRLVGTHLTASIGSLLGGYCSGGLGPQNNDVVEALSGERLVEREGDNVILRDHQGATRIILKPS